MRQNSHARKKRRASSSARRAVVFLLVVTMVLSVVTIVLLVNNARLRARLAEREEVPTSSDASTPDNTSSEPPKYKEEDLWKLKLVNGENVLPDNFTVETGRITPAHASKTNMQFDARAVDELNAMLAAAKADGINLYVISSYRTIAYQTGLYNTEVNKWINNGYSEENAKKKAGTIVAVPGTSDHNLGLAVDLNSLEETFEHAKEFDWLQEHAAEYGFVMRYPKDKQDITKIIYEPWHYRYVGKEHAAKMNELNMCLEEYVEYLEINE